LREGFGGRRMLVLLVENQSRQIDVYIQPGWRARL
jgi:hypothetical protein